MFVAAELIRPLDAGPGSPSKLSSGGGGGGLREGMKVEARFRGKLRYYPGVIRRENRDGTFDIDYNDVMLRSISYLCDDNHSVQLCRARRRCLLLLN